MVMEGRCGRGQKTERKEMCVKRATMRECFTPAFALTDKAPHLSSPLPPPSSPPLQWSPLMFEPLCWVACPHLCHVGSTISISLSSFYFFLLFCLQLVIYSSSSVEYFSLSLYSFLLASLFPCFLNLFPSFSLFISQFFLSPSTSSVSLYCFPSSSCLKVN